MTNKYKIYILFLAVTVLASSAKTVVAATVPPNIGNEGNAGSLNTRTLDILKQNQQLDEINKTLQDKKRKNNKNSDKEESKDKSIEETPPVTKAKPDEYKTKGVYIQQVIFSKSDILSENELQAFKNELTGKNLFISDINIVIGKINSLYAEKGYVTASAVLPPQTIEGGILHINLIEGKVGNIDVQSNKWTRKGYIEKSISEKPDNLFKITTLEKDLLNFNKYNDGIKLKANLTQGQTFGTTDITLNTSEKLPFHFINTWDNAGRDTIGKQRVGFMLQDDSLLGYRDKLTIGTYLTKASTTPYADYNIPINKHGGRVGFTFSSSFADIVNGNYQMFNISSRSYNYSLYLNQPLIRKNAFELTSNTAMNYKRAITLFDGNALYTNNVTSAETGLSAQYITKRGIWYANQTAYQAFPIADDQSKYFIYKGNIVRLHDFGHNIIGQFRSNYQWTPEDVVPYLDQFQGGGISSARGFSEGLLIGKTGYLFSGELLFPLLPVSPKIYDKTINMGQLLKGIVCPKVKTVFSLKARFA